MKLPRVKHILAVLAVLAVLLMAYFFAGYFMQPPAELENNGENAAAEQDEKTGEAIPGRRPAPGDSAAGLAEEAVEPSVLLYPPSPAPGDFFMLAVGPCPEETAIILGKDLPVTAVSPPYRSGEHTYFILGIGFKVPPGDYDFTVYLHEPGAASREIRRELTVAAPHFDFISFTVPAERMSGWTSAQLIADNERVKQARQTTEPYPLWNQPFILPVQGRVSSMYGSVRVINRQAPKHHAGVDFAVEKGTPVKAANDGVVRLTASLLAYGNVVIIDHGLNLSSSYLHLDSIAVEEGMPVGRGEIVGYVGETGFSTGPHLHWEVNLFKEPSNPIPINPMQLVKGDLFYLPTAKSKK